MGVMFAYHRNVHCARSFGAYFLSARSLSLGFYVVWQTLKDILVVIPFFKSCTGPEEPEFPEYDFLVFLCYMNVVFIGVVIAWDISDVVSIRQQKQEAGQRNLK